MGASAILGFSHLDIFFFFFFNSVIRPFQDYFSSYETGQSVGGAKTGEPREKPPGTPASRTWLVSHVARAAFGYDFQTRYRGGSGISGRGVQIHQEGVPLQHNT